MARVKRGVTVRARHKKVLKLSKGFRGRSATCYTVALRRLEKSWQYAYRDRRTKKRDFRSLWIQRINASVRSLGLVYSKFMKGLHLAGITLNKKVLSELAIHEWDAFTDVVNKAKAALSSADVKHA